MTLATPPAGLVRPTQGCVREALFSILAPELPGAVFADLFSGSGAAGLEALSRGASRAIFVERDPRHAAVLRRNVGEAVRRGLDPAAASIVCGDAFRWAERTDAGATIVFADPPYALWNGGGPGRLAASLAKSGALAPGGLFAAEGDSSMQIEEETPQWDLLRDRKYGKTRICIWRFRGLSPESHP